MISQEPERVFGSSKEGLDTVSSDGRRTYDERLNRILAAATGAIAQVGYDRASMRSIGKAAGVSLAGLYHYFENKEKMLFLIQFRTFSSLLNNLREKLHGVEDPAEQLRVMVRAHLGYFAANMDALKVCSHELDSLSGDDVIGAAVSRVQLLNQLLPVIGVPPEAVFDSSGFSDDRKQDGGGLGLARDPTFDRDVDTTLIARHGVAAHDDLPGSSGDLVA